MSGATLIRWTGPGGGWTHPRLFAALGRIGLASLFVLGGLKKVANFGKVAILMADMGLSPPVILLPLSIALELGAAPAAFALAAFTPATNVIFHPFWQFEGQRAELELSLFFKNVAIMGALVPFGASAWERAAAAPSLR